MKKLIVLVAGMVVLLGFSAVVFAQPAPTMYTLDNIYYYLVEGTEATWGVHSLEPQSGTPGGETPGYGKSLGDIYDDIKAKFAQCGASPGQVMDTVAFFSTATDNWGPRPGSIATRMVSNATVIQLVGYYGAFNLSTVDIDLAVGNIKSGVNIFGVSGNSNVVNTSSGTATPSDITVGKIAWVGGQEITGTRPLDTWYEVFGPSGSSDVVQIGSMYVASDKTGTGCANNGAKNWGDACSWGTNLEWLGKTDWRLPTKDELFTICFNKGSLTSYEVNFYWSSTDYDASDAWYVFFGDCSVGSSSQASSSGVRAVRSSE